MKRFNLQALPGTKDLSISNIKLYRYIEKSARDVLKLANFEEINTPIIERKELYSRSMGNTADVVEKQMFEIQDEDENYIVLRPEFTAGVVRSVIENNLYHKGSVLKLYSIGPLFRRERPQKGRLRQFNQINVEIIGSKLFWADIELIYLLDSLLNALKVSNWELHINSIGCEKCREDFKEVLKSSIKNIIASNPNAFCNVCKDRLERNVLRVLDCKNPSCVESKKNIPKITNYLCNECNSNFTHVISNLNFLKDKLVVDNYLVRGFDYYTGLVFEFISNDLGAQNAFGGGGRYDNLFKELGDIDIPACGFAIGVERLALISSLSSTDRDVYRYGVYIALVDNSLRSEAFKLVQELRRENIPAETSLLELSLKAQLRRANESKFKFTVIIGPDEVKQGVIKLRDMEAHQEELIRKDELFSRLKNSEASSHYS